jgi:hypothetical protein
MRSALPFLFLAAACIGSGSGDSGRQLPIGSGSDHHLVSATIAEVGGASITPAPGSNCEITNDTYTYDAMSHVATWRRCEEHGNTLVFTFADGQTELDSNTASQLETALANLQVGPTCGSDLHAQIVITWTTADSTFDQCAQGLNALDDVLGGLR